MSYKEFFVKIIILKWPQHGHKVALLGPVVHACPPIALKL
jgi:hypothetical protein